MRKDKNKFKFTIPLNVVKNLRAKTGDFLRIDFIDFHCDCAIRITKKSKSRKYPQIKTSIPKRFIAVVNPVAGNILNIRVTLLKNVRTNQLIKHGYLDLLAAVPWVLDDKLLLIEPIGNRLRIWYSNTTIPKPIIINRYIKINHNLGEFFGLIQAESSKKGGRFSFTNKLLNEIKSFIAGINSFGIIEQINYTIYYNPNVGNILDCEVDHFRRFLVVKSNISYVKNTCITSFAYNINICSTVLRMIMIHLLKVMRQYVANNDLSNELKEFSIGFITKDLIGDGTVVLNKITNALQINISEPDTVAQNEIRTILMKLNIKTFIQGIKIFLSTDFKSCLWLIKNSAFVGHNYNRLKLISYFLHLHYVKRFYHRFNGFSKMNVMSFSRQYNINYSAAQAFLAKKSIKGYLKYERRGLYSLSKSGLELINLIECVQEEYSSLTFHYSNRN